MKTGLISENYIDAIIQKKLHDMGKLIVRIMSVLAAAAVMTISGCEKHQDGTTISRDTETARIIAIPGNDMPWTRSEDPDENIITDINIFIFNAGGILEENIYADISDFSRTEEGYAHETCLLRDTGYSIYVCANTGYKIDAGNLDELKSFRYYLVYPDDYRTGIPMSGWAENITVPDDGIIRIPLERLMSKISLSIDRSELSDNVEFHVRKVEIGGCPKSVTPFRESRAETEDDVFLQGFSKEDDAVAPLNDDVGYGKSGQISVYMLENMHGDLLADDIGDDEKVFEDGNPHTEVCSYIEIEADYLSDEAYTLPGESLIYRFYLGESNGNFDVRRNRHYNFCVTPHDDGLGDDSWRIDKSAIRKLISEIRLSYSELEMTYMNETIRLEAFTYPEDAADNDVIWESDDTSIARISQDGTVTASGEGECTVRCSAADGSGIYAECRISVRFSPYYMKIYPGNFIRGKTGETIHVRCEYFPPSASFDIGEDYLETDRERGIYDYRIDDDGNGVVLNLKDNGSGLIYMETGYPLSQSEMIVIVVD